MVFAPSRDRRQIPGPERRVLPVAHVASLFSVAVSGLDRTCAFGITPLPSGGVKKVRPGVNFMKRLQLILALAAVLALGALAPHAQAHGGVRIGIGIGVPWYGPGYYPYGGYPYYPYYYPPPVYVVP